jgi:hypothetical protein
MDFFRESSRVRAAQARWGTEATFPRSTDETVYLELSGHDHDAEGVFAALNQWV